MRPYFPVPVETLWEHYLDFNMHATSYGEIRIPFAHFISPSASEPTGTTATGTFHPFTRLPAELQLRIFQLSDRATLFKLMQASPYTRPEAHKQLFSGPSAWYHVDGRLLLDRRYSNDLCCDTNFFPYVLQLDVELDRSWIEQYLYLGAESGTEERTKRIKRFWDLMRMRFSGATRVVLSEGIPRGMREEPLQVYRDMAGLCPCDLEVSLSTREMDQDNEGGFMFDAPIKRVFWRQSGSSQCWVKDWKKENVQAKSLPRILLPYATCHGAADRFQDFYRNVKNLGGQHLMAQLILIVAMAKSHFHGRNHPFLCPTPDCGVLFKNAQAYALHACRTKCIESAAPSILLQFDFAENQKRLEGLWRKYSAVGSQLREEWARLETHEQRTEATKWAYYSTNDPGFRVGANTLLDFIPPGVSISGN